MERDPSTAGPSGCDLGQESGHAQRKVSGSRIRTTNKPARVSSVGHIQFLSESSGVLTWAKNHVSNVYLKWENYQGSIQRLFKGNMSIQVHGTFSKHCQKNDENLIFVQVPLVPSNFWATCLKICLQWLLITPTFPFSQGFCGTWLHHKQEPIPKGAPLTCCPSAPGFCLHLQPDSSALSHHSFPCRSVQNQEINFTRSIFQGICLQERQSPLRLRQLRTGM